MDIAMAYQALFKVMLMGLNSASVEHADSDFVAVQVHKTVGLG